MKEKTKFRIGYTAGVFDLFHIGHLNILRRAKANCDILIVGVTTDELCFQRKGKFPVVSQADRVAIIEAIRYVDRVVLQEDMDKLAVVKRVGAEAVFVGSDWKGTPEWRKYEKEFANIGCEVIYLEHTEGISSTILRERINR